MAHKMGNVRIYTYLSANSPIVKEMHNKRGAVISQGTFTDPNESRCGVHVCVQVCAHNL